MVIALTALAPSATAQAGTPDPMPHWLSSSEVLVTDSGRPTTSTVLHGEPAPVGTTDRDASGIARRAAHRVYVSFDLTSLSSPDAVIRDVSVDLSPVYAEGCPPVDLTVSSVAVTSTPITWQSPPPVLATVARVAQPPVCEGPWAVDATAVARAALSRGQRTLRLEVRGTGSRELSPSFGRYLGSYVNGRASYDSPPFVVTGSATTNGFACTERRDATWVPPQPMLSAVVGGTESPRTVEIRVWRAGGPVPANGRTYVVYGDGARPVQHQWSESDDVSDGRYLWQVRISSATSSSAWTQPCAFSVDGARPAAPRVSAAADAVVSGQPFRFRIDGRRVTDVRCYQWAAFGSFSVPELGADPCVLNHGVRPRGPGGPVFVSVPTTRADVYPVEVRSVDRAGNVSDTSTVWVVVRSTAPTLDPTYGEGPAGTPIRFTATGNPSFGVTTRFRVTVDAAATRTVAATNGVATFTAAPVAGRVVTLRVVSVRSDGALSEESVVNLFAT